MSLKVGIMGQNFLLVLVTFWFDRFGLVGVGLSSVAPLTPNVTYGKKIFPAPQTINLQDVLY